MVPIRSRSRSHAGPAGRSSYRHPGRGSRTAAVGLLAGLLAASTVSLATSSGASAAPRVDPTKACFKCIAQGVAAIGPKDAWVVGFQGATGSYQTWLREWNGRHFHEVVSPNPGASNELFGVSGASPNDVWAVGFANTKKVTDPLIVHWDGSAWTQVQAPPVGNAVLYDVTAVSANDVWAVGYTNNGSGQQTLILHWDGSSWSQVTSPNPSGGILPVLKSVSGDAANDAWAVGTYRDSNSPRIAQQSMVFHWNGSTWSAMSTPNRFLNAVAATSPSDVWGVGTRDRQTDTEHWNGSSWSRVSSPNPGVGQNILMGVDARTSSDAWAVGTYDSDLTDLATTMHWNGASWTLVPVPSPDNSFLSDVSMADADDVWAIGIAGGGSRQHPLIVHWDGNTWTQF